MMLRQFFGVLLHGCPHGEGCETLDGFLSLVGFFGMPTAPRTPVRGGPLE